MPRLLVELLAVALLASALPGCAGFRGGWQSVAYLGDAPPAALEAPRAGTLPLELPGFKLSLSLDNRLRTRDTQIAVVPVGIDPRNQFDRRVAPGRTRLFVTVQATAPGVVFRGAEAVLIVGERRYTAIAAHEFTQWNAAGQRVSSGGRWEDRALPLGFELAEPGRTYYLSVDFEAPTPTPQQPGLAADLARALIAPQQPAVPLIRFAPVPWKEGYT